MSKGAGSISSDTSGEAFNELFSDRDEFGPLRVTQKGQLRVLSFGSSLEQSRVDMQRPYCLSHEYTRVMLLGLVLAEAQHITVLGLGGGGLAHCLSHYFPQMALTFVELRPKVVAIARRWFALPESKHLRVVCADALDYLQSATSASTDLLLSDLYEASGMSERQAQLEFIRQAARVLRPRGWLVLNFHVLPDQGSTLFEALQQYFTEVYVCDLFKGNWVLFCGCSGRGFSARQLKQRAKQLGHMLGMPMGYYLKQLRRMDSRL